MGATIEITCGASHADGTITNVATAFRVTDDGEPTWLFRATSQTIATQQKVESTITETVGGKVVDVYEELFGTPVDRANGRVQTKVDLRCENPFCGFHFQRHQDVVAPVLDELLSLGAPAIDLKVLALRVESSG